MKATLLKSRYLLLGLLMIFTFSLSFLNPYQAHAKTQQDITKGKTPTEKYSVTKIHDKSRIKSLEKEYNKYLKQKHKPIKNLSKSELNKLKKAGNPTQTVSSNGEIIKGNQDYKKTEATPSKSSSMETASTSDNRIKVSNTTSSPYNAMAQIDFRDASGNYYTCSGTFLDPDTVLTAAHCVYDNWNHQFYTWWNVYPGENGTTIPYGNFSSTSSYTDTGYITSQAPEPGKTYLGTVQYDYAVIKVNSNHPYSLSTSTSSYIGDNITSYGYPWDLSPQNGYYYLYKSSGVITNISSNALIHTSYVQSGMSGGPILKSNSIISVNSTASWAPKFTSTSRGLINTWKNY